VKVGDLVRYTPDGVVAACWNSWYGIVVRCIPGTDERKVIMWSKDNNVRTTTKKSDLELISGSR
jgi:hypothetical protein